MNIIKMIRLPLNDIKDIYLLYNLIYNIKKVFI